ncbi:MAG: hypothetical protein CMK56_08360 [Proteobacteria bacterium]|nr:hypothetical protein [Pseudomonadota bacterium]
MNIQFLKSINILQDIEYPERLLHFRPTMKSVSLLNRLLLRGDFRERTYSVIAPYGTGKSLTCAYLTQLVENRTTHDTELLIHTVSDRMVAVDPALASFSRERMSSKFKGMAIALEGYQPNLVESLREATVSAIKRNKLGRVPTAFTMSKEEEVQVNQGRALDKLLTALVKFAEKKKVDRIVLVWDEFGRHLEELVGNGQGPALAIVQQLAEKIARVTDLTISFATITHRAFNSYQENLPTNEQQEWNKVNGRFTSYSYTDDTIEIYELLGDVIDGLQISSGASKKNLKTTAERLLSVRLFSDFKIDRLINLLDSIGSTDPIAFYLLPLLAARTAQNERTMFSFLQAFPHDKPIGVDELYEYFSPSMEMDRGVGGSNRVWLETESACAKVDTDQEKTILRLTSLLGLTLKEKGIKVTPKLLSTVASIGPRSKKSVDQTIRSLMDRNLLLHRTHTDVVSLWHGTSTDLKERLRDLEASERQRLDLIEFLKQEYPCASIKPVRYNDQNAIRRFFIRHYVSSGLFIGQEYGRLSLGMEANVDGTIHYIFVENENDRKKVIEKLHEDEVEKRRLFAVVDLPAGIRDAAVELSALRLLANDEELIGQDPLIGDEISQKIDDVLAYLEKQVDFLLRPENIISWYHNGENILIRSQSELLEKLSSIMDLTFGETPYINNEMINRFTPNASQVSARKKVSLGILERYGHERLGIKGENADKAIFRSVLLETGLYIPSEPDSELRWRFVLPSEISDSNQRLKNVWMKFESFLTQPKKGKKEFKEFFRHLESPPIGLRTGIIPILLAAGLKAFPNVGSIARRNGDSINDLTPSEIEDICRKPEDFFLTVIEIDEQKQEFLKGIISLFSREGEENTIEGAGLLKTAHEAVVDWSVVELGKGARESRLIKGETRKLQRALRRLNDPQKLLLEDLFKLGGTEATVQKRLLKLETLKKEMEELPKTYQNLATRHIILALDDGVPKTELNLLETLKSWQGEVGGQIKEKNLSAEANLLLKSLNSAYLTESSAIERIGLVVTNQIFKHWSDEILQLFRLKFNDNISTIEAEVLINSQGNQETLKSRMLRNRLLKLAGALKDEVGEADTLSYLLELQQSLTEEGTLSNANSQRRDRKL